jgi:hypothetical protein
MEVERLLEYLLIADWSCNLGGKFKIITLIIGNKVDRILLARKLFALMDAEIKAKMKTDAMNFIC